MLGVAWLGVFGFSAVPVFMFYNIWSTCEVIKAPQSNGTAGVEQICVDIRQYGTPPPIAVTLRALPASALALLRARRCSGRMCSRPSTQCAPFSGWRQHVGS